MELEKVTFYQDLPTKNSIWILDQRSELILQSKLYKLMEKKKAQIWDTAGQERYRTITNAYYKGADGIIVVCDLTNKESFLSIDGWLSEVEKHSGSDV